MSYAITAFTNSLIAQDIPVDGVSAQVDPPTDPAAQITIQYQPTATPQQIQQGNAAISTFNWNIQPPNPAQFVAALTADATVQPILLLLAPYYAVIQSYALNPAAVQLIWSQLVATYPNQLTPTLQTTITGYATAANMPLTT